VSGQFVMAGMMPCVSGAPKFDPAEWAPRVEWLDRDIMLVRDALPFLRELPGEAEKLGGWMPSNVIRESEPNRLDMTEYHDNAQRTSQRIAISTPNANPAFASWAMRVSTCEGVLVQAYFLGNPHARVTYASGWDLLRYGPGDRFGEHVDVVRGNPILAQRRLSAVAFCNDAFKGGELHFPRQRVTVTPETGALVVFPSGFTHPHESTPVVSGVKYSLVTWFF